jgi:tetratricopeptide (TPR) repeat protein
MSLVNKKQLSRTLKAAVMIALAASLSLSGVRLCSGQSRQSGTQANQLFSKGLELARQGQLAEAEQILEQARRLAPNNTELLTVLGKVKGKIGEREPAIALFRQVIQLSPQSAEAHLNLGIALADDTQLDSALHEVSIAIHLAPKLASAHLTRARLLVDLHRPDDAVAEFAITCRLAPNDPEGYYYWALLERDEGKFAKEASLLQTVVKLQPQNYEAFYLLGCSLSDQSKELEAIAAWRRAIALNPNYSRPIYRLWQSLRRTNSPEAKQLQQRFLAIQKQKDSLGEIKSLGNQAYIAMQAQNWSAAIPLLRQALSLCGDCSVEADLHKDLGLALCRNGDIQEGQTELRIALKLNPDDPDTVKALAILAQQEKLRKPVLH